MSPRNLSQIDCICNNWGVRLHITGYIVHLAPSCGDQTVIAAYAEEMLPSCVRLRQDTFSIFT